MLGKYIARILSTGLLLVALFCYSQRPQSETIQATININKIVGVATQRPINSNIVTLRWETPEGKVIKTETYRNQSQLSTTMPADGSVRLFVLVEAPGYERWANAVRMKINAEKPLYINVEMERKKDLQG